MEIPEKNHHSRTGDKVVGEESEPDIVNATFCCVELFCNQEIRDDVVERKEKQKHEGLNEMVPHKILSVILNFVSQYLPSL